MLNKVTIYRLNSQIPLIGLCLFYVQTNLLNSFEFQRIGSAFSDIFIIVWLKLNCIKLCNI